MKRDNHTHTHCDCGTPSSTFTEDKCNVSLEGGPRVFGPKKSIRVAHFIVVNAKAPRPKPPSWVFSKPPVQPLSEDIPMKVAGEKQSVPRKKFPAPIVLSREWH